MTEPLGTRQTLGKSLASDFGWGITADALTLLNTENGLPDRGAASAAAAGCRFIPGEKAFR